MVFSEILNNYMDLLKCSPKELSSVSGLSPTIISRYLNGKRNPRANSEYFNSIVNGLYEISENKKINIDKSELENSLLESLNYNEINYSDFADNFNNFLDELQISSSDMAKSIGYDTSFISRVRNKNRKPSDLSIFIQEISNYIVKNFNSNEYKTKIGIIINCSISDLQDENNYLNLLVNWFSSPHDNSKIIKDFLFKLDTFNLNDYIKTDFDKIKVPTSPIILKNSKTYFGIDGRKQAEGDFLKTTLLSKSKEPIFFYSNLPISKAGEDESFKKKWMLAITMVLKKGLHLNIIHDIDRPLNEMLLGLESWIPIYMTGSISPYYFTNPPSNYYTGTHCTSGSVAMTAECIKGNEENSIFYVTSKKEELNYYKKKSKLLLSKAKPLMKIYKENDKIDFEKFLKENNVDLNIIKNSSLNNIDFYINQKDFIIINKIKKPEIHFVIYNKKLKTAIEKFLEL